MNRVPVGALGSYGAIELKKSYQANFARGLVLAALLHLVLIGGPMLVAYLLREDVENIPVITIRSVTDLAPPPSVQARPPQVQVEAPKIAPPSVGIPKPVADELVTEEVTIATRQELATLINPATVQGSGGEGQALVIDIPEGDLLPNATDFVAVEQEPVVVKKTPPEYPEMAKQTGLEGMVVVRILVYKDGTVKDVIVVRPSGTSVGFEEAAVAACKGWIFKPAIQNQKPVSVWVNYPIKFAIK
jgi:TonB family protein